MLGYLKRLDVITTVIVRGIQEVSKSEEKVMCRWKPRLQCCALKLRKRSQAKEHGLKADKNARK